MAARSVLQAFEKFQKERLVFVTTVGELAKTPQAMPVFCLLLAERVFEQNVEFLEKAGALGILKSLLLDNVPSIRNASVTALGRLAHVDDRLAEAVVRMDILPLLVSPMSMEDKYYKRAAAFCLRAVVRHSPQLAQAVVQSGAVAPLVTYLEDLDASVKEAAAWTLGYIASHAPDLAQVVTDSGVIRPLVLCLQEPEDSLKRIAASALGDIAKHSSDLSQLVVDADAVSHVAQMISTSDTKLRRQVYRLLSALTVLIRHSVHLAEVVIETQIFPKMLTSLKFPDEIVKKHAATLIREIGKHSPELAQLVVGYGSVAALVDHIADSRGEQLKHSPAEMTMFSGHFRLPSVMAVGFVAAFSETLASTVIAEGAAMPIADVVRNEEEDVLKSAAVWSLGQIGKHSSEHAKAIAETGILIDCVDLASREKSSEDLRNKCRQACRVVVSKLTHLPPLDALLHKSVSVVSGVDYGFRRGVEDGLMQLVLEQLSKVLEHDPQGRSQFVHTGGLALLQQMTESPDCLLSEVIETINRQYPEEIVMHYSPSYSQKLLEKLDAQISQTVECDNR